MHVTWQTDPLNRGQGEIKEADRSRFVGGRFNKQGNLDIRLLLKEDSHTYYQDHNIL